MNLTPKQLQTLRFIRAHRGEHGVSPTMRELGAALGIGPVGAFDRVKCLIRKGVLIRSGPNLARSLEVAEGALPPDERPRIPGVADPVAFLKAGAELERLVRASVRGEAEPRDWNPAARAALDAITRARGRAWTF